MKLTVMRGYPGSGKSTIAKELVTTRGATIRVCRDDLRKMILDAYWTGNPGDEMIISVAEKALVNRFLDQEYNVLVDATNLAPRVMQSWRSIAEAHGAEFEEIAVATHVDACLTNIASRVAKGGRDVPEEVVRQMAEMYPIEGWEQG